MHWKEYKDGTQTLFASSGVGWGYVQEVAGLLFVGVRTSVSNQFFDRKPFKSLEGIEATKENIKKAKAMVEFEARLRGC